jgi:helicase POLQ-like
LASNAHSLLRFVTEIDDFWAYKSLFPELCQRLSYCCIPELIPLLELPYVKLGRAKLLYNAGYHSISDIARAKVEEMVKNVENILPGQARLIISGAKKILIDQADELQEKANDLTTAISS